MQQYQPPLIIDEIQYATELLPYIKIRADQTNQNGMYYLTSSQIFHMMKNVSESLAGRVGILSMYSLSRADNPRVLELSAMSGAMFENYVVSEIIKGYANHGIDTRSRLCYYRDNNGMEIDLMISDNGIIYPIEIKKVQTPAKTL